MTTSDRRILDESSHSRLSSEASPLPFYNLLDTNESSQVLSVEVHRFVQVGQHIIHSYPTETCPICFDDFNIESILILLNCGHLFDRNCIITWLNEKTTCPKCRCQVGSIPIIELVL